MTQRKGRKDKPAGGQCPFFPRCTPPPHEAPGMVTGLLKGTWASHLPAPQVFGTSPRSTRAVERVKKAKVVVAARWADAALLQCLWAEARGGGVQ